MTFFSHSLRRVASSIPPDLLKADERPHWHRPHPLFWLGSGALATSCLNVKDRRISSFGLSGRYGLGRISMGIWIERVTSRSEEHTSELQSLMRISYAVFCLKNKKKET